MHSDSMENFSQVAITRNYSLTLPHIAKVSDMAQRTGKSQSEIVRMAIDLLFEQMEAQLPNPSENGNGKVTNK